MEIRFYLLAELTDPRNPGISEKLELNNEGLKRMEFSKLACDTLRKKIKTRIAELERARFLSNE